MRARVSAGLVLYRFREGRLEVFLAHPGGPYFVHKDEGHWTIPKGEIEPGEDPLATALREVQEETGLAVDPGRPFLDLGSIRQKGGKIVHAWGVEQELPADFVLRSNLFVLEWPPGSGVEDRFPEVDRAEFFPIAEARQRIKPTQIPLLDQLEKLLAGT